MQKEYIEPLFESALKKLGVNKKGLVSFSLPKNPDHGDLSTNIAMQLARDLKKSPRKIAEEILENIEYDKELVTNIDIAGAGFINITFSNKFYAYAAQKLLEQGEQIGRWDTGKGKKVNVEYVSVNPTGLLHLGHGRNAAIGDTIANFYDWLGYDVTREYYFNNAGNQMQNLAKSIYARYMQMKDPDFPFPDDGYHGDYIRDIAAEIREERGDELKEGTYQDISEFKKYGENWCFERINKTLARMGIKQDLFYNEDTLYSSGKIKKIIDDFNKLGLTYEKDGAVWLKLTELGLEDDRVIVKSTGEPTYRLPDMAYHREKFLRGFDIIVDIFGADHIATVPDVLAAVKALGFDPGKVVVLVHQFVTITEGGEQVKMSKRSGKVYTLDDLLDEVGPDVVRFFLLIRGMSTHLEFDLDLAREQSDKNPVFYLQYAHARISSIFRNAEEREIKVEDKADFNLLKHESEINLIKTVMNFPDIVLQAGTKHEPQVLAEYLRELAASFHVFYHNCRVLGEEENLMQARLNLAKITRYALANGLKILGISAPESM